LLRLAAPLFIAQLAVTANGLIDTLMAGRLSAVDVAAVGLGASIYVSIHIALMGILLALAPICARLFGAQQHDEIAAVSGQGVWLALLIAIPGCIALGVPDLWLDFAGPPPEVAAIARPYLIAVAIALPAALLFRVFHALAVSTSQPQLVMILNLAALGLKIPANGLFMYGWSVDEIQLIAPMGGAGCAVATACITWLTLAAAMLLLARHPGLNRYGVLRPRAPDRRRLLSLLRLGLPIGLTQLVEVTAFTFMAIFLAHTGAVIAASHQVAASSAALCYMVALAIGLATSTLAAQALGAGDPALARKTALGGLVTALIASSGIGLALFTVRGPYASLFTTDPAVLATATTLLGWVALFHVLDSLQTQFTMILRAWHVTAGPALIHTLALWGVGLGGGWWLAFKLTAPGAALEGWFDQASSFWVAGCISLGLASIALAALLMYVWHTEQRGITNPDT
jgi:MATE family multidrug resistance protein